MEYPVTAPIINNKKKTEPAKEEENILNTLDGLQIDIIWYRKKGPD